MAKSKAVVSGKTSSSRANRSSVSTAKVTGSGNFERSDRQKTSTAKVTTGVNRLNRAPANKITQGQGTNLARASKLAGVLGVARSLTPAGVAYNTLKPKPTASGTLTAAAKRGDYKTRQGPTVPSRLTQGGMDKGSFDSAFKSSRTAGKKTFTWRGKKYTIKKAGE